MSFYFFQRLVIDERNVSTEKFENICDHIVLFVLTDVKSFFSED